MVEVTTFKFAFAFAFDSRIIINVHVFSIHPSAKLFLNYLDYLRQIEMDFYSNENFTS